MKARYILSIVITSILVISFGNVYGENTQNIEVEIKYTNGDIADFSGMEMRVYQDFNKSIFLKKILESNPDIITVPENHRYKIEIYANGMYGDVEYVQVNERPEKILINIPISGGLKFNVFYNDGHTPIKDARIVIKSNDGKEWRQGTTNNQGETVRYWIQSTVNQDDYYIADVFLGEIFLKSQYPIKLLPGLARDEKIVVDIPETVEDLIKVTLYKDSNTKISASDKQHTVILTNMYTKESISSEVNIRGEANFSNLKSGTYLAKITPNEEERWPESTLEIIGKSNQFNIFKKIIKTTSQTSKSLPESTESCNCVAFRFDDVQDYWLNDVQIQFINTFVENKIPLTVGIIADSFGNDPKITEFVKNNIKNNLEIANHGVGNIPFTEYTKDEQDFKIKESVQKIKDVLDITPKVFIPPQNRFNEDTEQVLIDNGFTHMSSSLLHGDAPPFSLKDEKLFKFPEISTTGTFDLKENIFVGVPHEETFSGILEGLDTYGFAVITSHPQEFSTVINGTYSNEIDHKQISELKMLIEKIQEKGISIVKISQINIDSKTIPVWIKNNAGWWADDSIDDDTFVKGIEYLIQQKIITVSEKSQIGSNQQNIPNWIKNNAGWWADDSIDDDTFVKGIEYLVKNGIVTY